MNLKLLPQRLVLFAALLFTAQSANALFIMKTSPAADTIGIGQTLNVDLLVDATAGDAFIGFGLDVLFDTSVLNLNTFTFASVFDGPTTAIQTNPGVLELTAFQAFPFTALSGNDRLLGTLSFQGIAQGNSLIDFAFPGLGAGTDGLFQPIPPGGSILPDTVVPGSIAVGTSVPVPTTLGLALLGIAAIGRLRQSRGEGSWRG